MQMPPIQSEVKTQKRQRPSFSQSEASGEISGDKAEPPLDSFELDASSATRCLTVSLSRLLDSLPGKVGRPADLERILKIDNPLASRLWRLAGAADPVAAVSLLPTMNQLRTAVRAAGKAGAAGTVTSAALDAVDAFDQFVQKHAGELPQFEAMVARSSGETGQRLMLKHRRAAFKANGQVWGRQARVMTVCGLFFENQKPGGEDSVLLRGFVDFHVLQPQMEIEMRARLRYAPQFGSPDGTVDPRDARIEIPRLINAFTQGQSPKLVEVPDVTPGVVAVQLRLPSAGRSGTSTFFMEQCVRDTDSRAQPNPFYAMTLLLPLPVELVQIELWVPRGWSNPNTLTCKSFADINLPERARACRDVDQIECHARAEHFSSVNDTVPAPDVPGWSKVIDHVLGEHGLRGREFDVYRTRLQYPMLHSVLMLRVEATPQAAG